MAVTMEMDLNHGTLQREHVTFVDLLSDIGGFSSILTFIVTVVLTAFHKNDLAQEFLVNELFDLPVKFKNINHEHKGCILRHKMRLLAKREAIE